MTTSKISYSQVSAQNVRAISLRWATLLRFDQRREGLVHLYGCGLAYYLMRNAHTLISGNRSDGRALQRRINFADGSPRRLYVCLAITSGAHAPKNQEASLRDKILAGCLMKYIGLFGQSSNVRDTSSLFKQITTVCSAPLVGRAERFRNY